MSPGALQLFRASGCDQALKTFSGGPANVRASRRATGWASSVTDDSPPRRRARIARRVGSAGPRRLRRGRKPWERKGCPGLVAEEEGAAAAFEARVDDVVVDRAEAVAHSHEGLIEEAGFELPPLQQERRLVDALVREEDLSLRDRRNA